MKMRTTLLCATLALAACQPAPDPEAARAAQAAAQEQAAEAMARQFDEQFAAQNWSLASAHGDVLQAEYPRSEAAARIEAQHAEATAKSGAAANARRVEALWAYQSEPVGAEQQLSAAIYAKDNLETDGASPRPVRLIFRDHPEWGDSAYLTLEAGDFDCYGGCNVQVTVDDAEPKSMEASRPDTDEAIAMFIEDERALWALAQDAEVIAIEFPIEIGGTRIAVFEVGGLDPSTLPDWN